MRNYSESSEFEINKRVAELVGYKVMPKSNIDDGVYVYGRDPYKTFDPCNSWADGGPIIDKYDVDLVHVGDEYGHLVRAAQDIICGKEITVISDNTLRAAMEVFLMVVEIQDVLERVGAGETVSSVPVKGGDW